jgi:outer membrane protein TolC
VDIPLVNWGATDLRVQQQQLTVNNLRLESERLQRSVTSQARQTRLQILRLRDRLGSVRQSLKQAEENFVLTKSKFVGGGTLSLEVLSAQQLLTETWLLELQTLADIQLLTAKLEQLTAR